MSRALERRVVAIEDRERARFRAKLEAMTDEELRALAGPSDPTFDAVLRQMTVDELEGVVDGRWPSRIPYPASRLLRSRAPAGEVG